MPEGLCCRLGAGSGEYGGSGRFLDRRRQKHKDSPCVTSLEGEMRDWWCGGPDEGKGGGELKYGGGGPKARPFAAEDKVRALRGSV